MDAATKAALDRLHDEADRAAEILHAAAARSLAATGHIRQEDTAAAYARYDAASYRLTRATIAWADLMIAEARHAA